MSDVPTTSDVLGHEVAGLPIPDVAARLGQPVSRIHQMLRDGQLLAFERDGVRLIPEYFLTATEPAAVVKGLPGAVTLLRDAAYTDDEILQWLFTEDDTLPGAPIDALRSDRGREVKRRAQAMGF